MAFKIWRLQALHGYTRDEAAHEKLCGSQCLLTSNRGRDKRTGRKLRGLRSRKPGILKG